MSDQLNIIKFGDLYLFLAGLPNANPDGLIPKHHVHTDLVTTFLVYGNSRYILFAIIPTTSGDEIGLAVQSVLDEIWGRLWWRGLVDSADTPEPRDLTNLAPGAAASLVVDTEGLVRFEDVVIGRLPQLA